MTTTSTTPPASDEDQAAPVDALPVDAALGPVPPVCPEAVDREIRHPAHPPSAYDRPLAGQPDRRVRPHRGWHLDGRPVQGRAPLRRPGVDRERPVGGNVVLLDFPVMRHAADIEAIHTYEGTETIQTLIVGKDITGVGAFT
jgi:alkylation response protein AidB-like acyl-CoA dehydrogenase